MKGYKGLWGPKSAETQRAIWTGHWNVHGPSMVWMTKYANTFHTEDSFTIHLASHSLWTSSIHVPTLVHCVESKSQAHMCNPCEIVHYSYRKKTDIKWVWLTSELPGCVRDPSKTGVPETSKPVTNYVIAINIWAWITWPDHPPVKYMYRGLRIQESCRVKLSGQVNMRGTNNINDVGLYSSKRYTAW